MISAGRLTAKIRIESHSQVKDASGNDVENWQEVATRRAEPKTRLSRQKDDQAGEYAESDIEFSLRYDDALAGVDEQHRVVEVFSSVTYEVDGVLNVGLANRELKLYCTRVSRSG